MCDPSQESVSNDSENSCVVCCKFVEIYSIGVCDHPVCFECSTRMRVLCHQNECPICRGQMPQVVFSPNIESFSSLYSQYKNTDLQDRKFGMIFCSQAVKRAYLQLLEFRCALCSGNNAKKYGYPTFQQLKDHMRREHNLLYCELCVNNLKIFAFERKCYTKQELGYHRRKGDPDNTSHRGHPLCEFCDTRFMDSDELLRHLRREHLFCHYCDADGKNQYYNIMDDLRRHFREEHYLCEEGECKSMPLTAVFRTDIDLKAHIATEHSRHMSKSATKQARTLELKFTLAPRPRPDRNKKMPPYRNEDEGAVGYDIGPGGPAAEVKQITSLTPQDFPALGNSSSVTVQSRPISNVNFTSKVNPFSRDDFPSLGGSRSSAVTITANSTALRKKTPEVTITRNVRGENLTKNAENFPRLEPSSAGTSTVHLSLNNGKISAPKVSIHVNHNSNGAITTTTHITTNASKSSTSSDNNHKSVEAFPALGNSTVLTQPQWIKPKPKKVESRSIKVAPPPQLPPSDLSQFPTLSRSSKSETKVSNKFTVSDVKDVKSDNNSKKSSEPSSSKSRQTEKPSEMADNKGKNTKKQKRKVNNSSSNGNLANNKSALSNHLHEPISKAQDDAPINSSDIHKNGIVKKRSELNIGSLTLTDTKPPPGFNVKFPPASSNDLTFTNSSGQSYAIKPTHYIEPNNFAIRNQNLIRCIMNWVESEQTKQFKLHSASFREGSMPADKYYSHCETVLGPYFDQVFPELLVLLPDISKQQELYQVFKGDSKRNLSVCENCKQVIFKWELSDHYNGHTLDSHFPNLRKDPEMSSAWRK